MGQFIIGYTFVCNLSMELPKMLVIHFYLFFFARQLLLNWLKPLPEFPISIKQEC